MWEDDCGGLLAASCISRSISWSWATTSWACSICLSGMNPCWIRVRCANTSLCVLNARSVRVYRGLTINGTICYGGTQFFHESGKKRIRKTEALLKAWIFTIPTTRTIAGSMRRTFMQFCASMAFLITEFRISESFRPPWFTRPMCGDWSIRLPMDNRRNWLRVLRA